MFIVHVRVEISTTSYPYQAECLTRYFYRKSNKMHQCLNLFYFLKKHSTCFGRSFRPSSGIQDCTYCNRHMSNRTDDCLLAELQFHLVPASKQSSVLFDIYTYLLQYVQS